MLPTGTGFLSASGLPELPETETYQLWGVYGDEDVISLGVLGNRPGIEPFTAEDDVADARHHPRAGRRGDGLDDRRRARRRMKLLGS